MREVISDSGLVKKVRFLVLDCMINREGKSKATNGSLIGRNHAKPVGGYTAFWVLPGPKE